jgi:uncharacterized protein YjbI with pentapeptide repeats
VFHSSMSTLRGAERGESEDNLLAILARRADVDGGQRQVFVDRDPVLFSYIVKYLRSGRIPTLAQVGEHALWVELADEAEYFCLERFQTALKEASVSEVQQRTAKEMLTPLMFSKMLTLQPAGRAVRFHMLDCSGVSLAGVDFLKIDFSSCDFRGTELRGAKLDGRIAGCTFDGADLTGAQLSGSMTACTFSSVCFDGTKFAPFAFNDCRFSDVSFQHFELKEGEKKQYSSNNKETGEVRFHGCTFSDVKISVSELDRALNDDRRMSPAMRLSKVTRVRVDFSHCSLSKSEVCLPERCILDLSETSMDGATKEITPAIVS